MDKGRPFTNSELVTAVNEWISNSTNATAKYGNINDWNTSEVTSMDSLFRNKNTFNSNISGWNTAKVTNMRSMFRRTCFQSKYFQLGCIQCYRYRRYVVGMYINNFNQPLNNWNTSKVNRMPAMITVNFIWQQTVFNQNISSWDMSKVTTILSYVL